MYSCSALTLHLSTAFEALCEHTEGLAKKVFNGKEGSKWRNANTREDERTENVQRMEDGGNAQVF